MRTSLCLAIQAARRSALWTEDGGIFNSRAMSRRPKPFALSLTTSAVHPLMIAREDALRRWASVAGRPGPTPRWRGGGFASTPTNSKRRPEQRQPRVVNMNTVGIQETSCQLESGREWAVRSAVEDARVTRTQRYKARPFL